MLLSWGTKVTIQSIKAKVGWLMTYKGPRHKNEIHVRSFCKLIRDTISKYLVIAPPGRPQNGVPGLDEL